MMDYYSSICDIVINRKTKTNHIKSKSHLYMDQTSERNKHVIGDIYWDDVEKTIRQYINENKSKFCFFKTVVKCHVHGEEINIGVCGDKQIVRLYKFDNNEGYFYYQFCISKKVREFLYHRAMLKEIDLIPTSIINNLTITIFSYYNSITPRYRLQRPRKILESKLIKHKKTQVRMIK